MPVITPFAGWRYDPGKADYARVTTPPSREIDEALQQELYKLDDRNCVRLVSGRGNAADVAAHLDGWREEALFLQDKPAIYVYEQSFPLYGEICHRRGFFARVLLAESGTEGIYASSKADEKAVEKTLATMKAARCDLEPVCAVLTDPSADISRSLHEMCKYDPTASFHSSGDVMNYFWVLDNQEQAAAFCGGCSQENLLIYAGQETYDAALLHRNSVREAMKNAGQTPPALGGLECDYVMMYVVPDGDPGLKPQAMHRVLHGFSLDIMNDLPSFLDEQFDLEIMPDVEGLMWKVGESEVPAFGLAHKGKFYCCTKNGLIPPVLAFAGMPEGWSLLDGVVLQRLVFEKIPGWQTQTSSKVQYIFDTEDVLQLLEQKNTWAQCAFLMRPAGLEQFRSLCRSGSMLPPNSLHFSPEPLTGLVFNFLW